MRPLSRMVTNIYDGVLCPLGNRARKMDIFTAVSRMGTTRPVKVCERLLLDLTTSSHNFKRMKARDWLEVIPDKDGGAQPFRLTNEGRKLLEQVVAEWKRS